MSVAIEPRSMRRRRVIAGAVILVFAIGSMVVAHEALFNVDDVNCDEFTFSRADWRGSDTEARRFQALGLDQCDTLDGQRASEVSRLLGVPAQPGDSWILGIPRPEGGFGSVVDQYLVIKFRSGKVARTEIEDG
jgi:hypothetical protein